MSASDSAAKRSAVDASTELAPKATLEAMDAPKNNSSLAASATCVGPSEDCYHMTVFIALDKPPFDVWSAYCMRCGRWMVSCATFEQVREKCLDMGLLVVVVRQRG